MSSTDPIGDCFSRVRNAALAGHDKALIPYSALKENAMKVLEREGYVQKVSVETTGKAIKTLVVELKYRKNGKPMIQHLSRVSRPGLRTYQGVPTGAGVRSGLGFQILSTSKGVLTDREAKEKKVGGEVIGQVW